MTWLFIALLAYFLFAAVFVMDKFILARPIKNPLVYAFYPGFLGILAVVAIPFFKFQILSLSGIIYSILAGFFYIWALVFFYKVLQAGEASRIVTFIGALVPIATLVFSYLFGVEKLSGREGTAFIFLVAGSILVSLGRKNRAFWKHENFEEAVLAAILLGFSFALTKIVYNQTDFVSGFIWTRFGGFIFSAGLLLVTKWRREIRSITFSANTGSAVLFFSDKTLGSLALILQSYAIALGSVVLVNALQAIQYVFVLIFASILSVKFPKILHETVGRGAIFQKIISIIIIAVGFWFLATPAAAPESMSYGVNFSQKFSRELGFDWHKNYTDILDDLKVRDLRLVAYWDLIEPEKDKFDFKDIDWQITEADKRGAKILLVVGRKTPRWPECHEPDWVKKLSPDEEKTEILNMLQNSLNHFKNFTNVWAWQVENEPLFPFGDCKPLSLSFLNQEVNTIRSLDKRPVVLTDAGELGFAWPVLIPRSDIFGTTLYRRVYNRVLGYTNYWFIPSSYFRLKALIAVNLFKKQVLISELQAEPWGVNSLDNTPLDVQYKTMSPQIFQEVIDYTRNSGFPKAYFWGVEWWYWLKEKRNVPDMWNEAKKVIE